MSLTGSPGILAPPRRRSPAHALTEFVFDMQLFNLVDHKKQRQAEAIAISDGEDNNLYTLDLVKQFIRNYKPDEVLLFLFGPAAVERISQSILGDDLLYELTDTSDEKKQLEPEVLTKRLIENILYVLVRRSLEAAKLPDEVSSEDVKSRVHNWIESQRGIPSVLPEIPEYKDVLKDVIDEIIKMRRILDRGIKIEARLFKEYRRIADNLIAGLEECLCSFKKTSNEMADAVEEYDRLTTKLTEMFSQRILQEERSILKIDEKISELKGIYWEVGLKEESYEFIAASECLKERIAWTGELSSLDFSVFAIGLWKAAELEIQHRFKIVLQKLGWVIEEPSLNKMTIGQIEYAFRRKTLLIKGVSGRSSLEMPFDPERFHSEWTGRELWDRLTKIRYIRNPAAHTRKLGHEEYLEMRAILLDGTSGLIKRLDRLQQTRQEEEEFKKSTGNSEGAIGSDFTL